MLAGSRPLYARESDKWPTDWPFLLEHSPYKLWFIVNLQFYFREKDAGVHLSPRTDPTHIALIPSFDIFINILPPASVVTDWRFHFQTAAEYSEGQVWLRNK